MGRIRKWTGRMLASALTASMLISSCAAAEPASAKDEFLDIIERQNQMQTELLLSRSLELSRLGEAIAENGFSLQVRGGLTEETMEIPEFAGALPGDGYSSFGIQVDPKLKKWLCGGSFGVGEESYGDFSLYGDEEQLAVSIPQLYAGAVGLRAGNFGEQYRTSAFGQMMGDTEEAPDLEMVFYPDLQQLDWVSSIQELAQGPEKQMELQLERARVEKTEGAEETVYHVILKTEDYLEIYKEYMMGYMDLFRSTGLMFENQAGAYEQEVDLMLRQMEAMWGEEMQVDCYVQDGLVTRITCEQKMDGRKAQEVLKAAEETEQVLLNMAGQEPDTASETSAGDVTDEASETGMADAADEVSGTGTEDMADEESETGMEDMADEESETGTEDMTDEASETGMADAADEVSETGMTEAQEQIASGTAEGSLAEAGVVSMDAEFVNSGFVGTSFWEIAYRNPENMAEGIDLSFTMTEADGGETVECIMAVTGAEIQEEQQITLEMEMRENGETIYSGTPIRMKYNAADGTLNMAFEVKDETTGETAGFYLDSTITKTEDAPGFVWNISRLAAGMGEQQAGVKAEITMKAAPGIIEIPESTRMLLELDTDALIDFLMEIQMNMERIEQEMNGVSEDENSMLQTETPGEGETAEPDSEAAETAGAAEDAEAGSEPETAEGAEVETKPSEDKEDAGEEIGAYANAGTVIIGGADGPTSIFLAGKLG